MLRKVRNLSAFTVTVLFTLGLIGYGVSAQPADTDSDEVGLIVVGGSQQTPTPSPTATVSPTPTATVVPQPTTPGGGGDPAPVVSKLPDTGTSGATSATSLALLSTLAVGLVLVTGALAGSARRNG